MRRTVVLAGAVAVVAAVLVIVGRAERSRERSAMLNGIDAVRAAIGPSLTRPGPTDYVLNPGLSCLLYAAGGRSYALELCADPHGRVVEAFDRRGSTTRVYSILPENGRARLTITPSLVSSLIAKVQSDHRRRSGHAAG